MEDIKPEQTQEFSNQSSTFNVLDMYAKLRNFLYQLYIKMYSLIGAENNKFYFRIFMIFITLVTFAYGYMTTALMNILYFLNLFVSSVKYMSPKSADNECGIKILKGWITYSVVVIFEFALNFVTDSLGLRLFRFMEELIKIVMYYNLFGSDVLSNKINDTAIKVYETNKTGIDTVQSGTISVTQSVYDSFNKENIDELIDTFKNYKNKKIIKSS
jgi:hypothetical protein